MRYCLNKAAINNNNNNSIAINFHDNPNTLFTIRLIEEVELHLFFYIEKELDHQIYLTSELISFI